VALSLGLVAGFVVGCHRTTEPAMRIGMNVWPGYEPLFLARAAGRLPESEYRLVEFSNASGVARSFRNGTIEAACLTLDEVIYTIQDGMDPVIVLVLDQSHGADVVLARPELRDLAGLKGKRIGVEVNAVGTYTLTRALQHGGLTLHDVTVVHLPLEKHHEAFASRTVDAVVTFEPARTKILALGAIDIFNSAAIPGEIVDVLVVRRDYAVRHPDRLAALRDGWFAALAQLQRSPRQAAQIMAVREQVTTEEFEASLNGLYFPNPAETRAMIGGPQPQLLATGERLKKVMRDAKLLERDVPLTSLFTPVSPAP
jgi:NitT/TauT family transport system substrate-binding protein